MAVYNNEYKQQHANSESEPLQKVVPCANSPDSFDVLAGYYRVTFGGCRSKLMLFQLTLAKVDICAKQELQKPLSHFDLL